jgi:lipopolysaccharide/colanic/teichoic acid biosynthesis glycosyltransferase
MSVLHSRLSDNGPAARASVALQRCFDVVCSLGALAVLAPVMLLVAIAIWVETGRPFFYAQTRIGRHGCPFLMYKFRKFGSACDGAGSPLTLHNDRRLTAVGRILALTKLDELPQFYNILRGEMSIVGPRPESLVFADCFRGRFERLLDFKPGLFGPAQIVFRNEQRFLPAGADVAEFYRLVLFPVKARIDLDYYINRSFAGDLIWTIRGVLAVAGVVPDVPHGQMVLDAAREVQSTKSEGGARDI